ncbi:MAG: amidohydrolase, partial [Pirellulales bacterium]
MRYLLLSMSLCLQIPGLVGCRPVDESPAVESPADESQHEESGSANTTDQIPPATGGPPLDGREGRNLALNEFRPQSKLKVNETLLTRAAFPVVDVHTHPHYRLRDLAGPLDDYVALMDKNNIAVSVSLDGRLGDDLNEHIAALHAQHDDRFVVFANLDFQGGGKRDDPATWDCHRPDFGRRTARQLAAAKQAGAVGLKFFKQFGLEYKNPDGSLIAIDDRRWDAIWQACGELG